MTWTTLTVEEKDNVATITLKRPERANTINGTMIRELVAVQQELSARDNVLAVIVTGAGRHFCGGADLRDLPPPDPNAGISLDLFPQPTIAAINGAALGGGCELTLACDFRIMSSTAQIGLPEIRFGALPLGGGTARLPRIVGLPMAKRLIMTGEPMDATEAERIGLVHQVTDPDELLPEAERFAQVLCSRAPYAMRTAKVLLDQALDTDLEAAVAKEKELVINMGSQEQKRLAREQAAGRNPAYANIFSKADS